MIKFCYDNIEANNLILEFKCKECHTLTETELLSVPKMDFDTFKNVSSLNKHKCQDTTVIYPGISSALS